MYAIVDDRGSQIKVEEGSVINVDLMDVEKGASIVFDKVLLVANGEDVKVGTPVVANAKVEAVSNGNGKDRKILAYKYKRRKGYEKRIGHRTQYTTVQIKSITA